MDWARLRNCCDIMNISSLKLRRPRFYPPPDREALEFEGSRREFNFLLLAPSQAVWYARACNGVGSVSCVKGALAEVALT